MIVEEPADLYELHDRRAEQRPEEPGRSQSQPHSITGLQRADSNDSETSIFAAQGNVQELAPVDRGRKAWLFCLSACVVETMVWGFGFSYGIFQDYYTSNPPFNTASPVAISAIGTVAIALQYAEAFFVLLIFKRYPDFIRPAMWASLGLFTFSFILASFATKVWQLILLQGVGIGIGGGILYVPVLLWIPEWFVERRGLAGGIIFGGAGVGGFVFPFVMNALLREVGFRWTLRIWGLITLVLCGLACLGLQPRIPIPKYSRHERRPPLSQKMPFFGLPVYWSFITSNVFQGLSFFPVSLYIAAYTATISSPINATIVLSLLNSASAIGQVIIGHLCDRFPYYWIMVLSGFGSAASAFTLWGFANSLAPIFVFAIVFGGLSGGYSSIWHGAAMDCAGSQPELSSFITSSFAATKGISAVTGPIIAGTLRQRSNHQMGAGFGKLGFGSVELFVGGCAIVTSVGGLMVGLLKRINK